MSKGSPMADEILHFFSEEIEFTLTKQDSVRHWILFFVAHHQGSIEELNFIFCSDEYLLRLNQTHLGHDFYTDIITFPYHLSQDEGLKADIYISLDRVRENAIQYDHSFQDELHRVMIHGILHLLGYDDHQEADRKKMREAEDKALAARSFL